MIYSKMFFIKQEGGRVRGGEAEKDKMLISGLWKIRFLCSCYVGDEKENEQQKFQYFSSFQHTREHKSRVNRRNVKAT